MMQVEVLPIVSGSMGVAKVVANHRLNDGHFIQFIWAKNQNGVIVAATKLEESDSPELEFNVPGDSTSIIGYVACNK
jgi:desulfoferrodoxin (superoxide reductase-like protein)